MNFIFIYKIFNNIWLNRLLRVFLLLLFLFKVGSVNSIEFLLGE